MHAAIRVSANPAQPARRPLIPPDCPLLSHSAEAYVDNDTFAFARGPHLVAVLTAGPHSRAPRAPPPASYPLANLTAAAGTELCDVLTGVRAGRRPRCAVLQRTPLCCVLFLCCAVLPSAALQCLQSPPAFPSRPGIQGEYCVRVAPDGTARVAPSPTHEPLILVSRDWLRPHAFFTAPGLFEGAGQAEAAAAAAPGAASPAEAPGAAASAEAAAPADRRRA